MTTFKNEEETKYRRLQKILNEAMKAGEDEYSDDDGLVTTKEGKPIPKFRHPKRLRGWMYLERVRIPPRDVPGLLNQIKTTNITRLQTCLIDA